MPARCNRGFYFRSNCLLNMFRAPLCPSSGAQEYCTVVAACGISCCGFQVVGLVWSWGLRVRFAGCCSILQTGASNKICTKNLCCIKLAFYFHILTKMHGQNHIKYISYFLFSFLLQKEHYPDKLRESIIQKQHGTHLIFENNLLLNTKFYEISDTHDGD